MSGLSPPGICRHRCRCYWPRWAVSQGSWAIAKTDKLYCPEAHERCHAAGASQAPPCSLDRQGRHEALANGRACKWPCLGLQRPAAAKPRRVPLAASHRPRSAAPADAGSVMSGVTQVSRCRVRRPRTGWKGCSLLPWAEPPAPRSGAWAQLMQRHLRAGCPRASVLTRLQVVAPSSLMLEQEGSVLCREHISSAAICNFQVPTNNRKPWSN